jgi:Ca2+-binding RTX toxin-like protein
LGSNLENLILEGSATNGSGNELNNTLVGNALNNLLTGNAGNDRLRGEMGWDYLYGSAGDDILEGGEGRDVMFGGAGRDTFIWRSISETSTSLTYADIVKDFSFADRDRLSLKLMDANEVQAGNQAFDFVGTAGFSAVGQVRYVQKASETWILFNTDADWSSDGVIRLPGRVNPEATWFDL